MPRRTPFSQFVRELTQGQAEPLAENNGSPPWFEPGQIHQVDVDIYDYFLEALPPRWMNGSHFLLGDGPGPFRLFWTHRGDYFGRELDEAEAERFFELAGISIVQ